MPDRRILTLAGCAALLVLAAAAERAGAPTATFYLLLLGVLVASVAALATLERLVDAGRGRLDALLAGALVVCFLVGAAARSPVLLGTGSTRVAPAALAAAMGVLAVLAAATAPPLRR